MLFFATVHGQFKAPPLEVCTASSIIQPVTGVDVHLQHLHHPLVPPCAIDEFIQRELPLGSTAHTVDYCLSSHFDMLQIHCSTMTFHLQNHSLLGNCNINSPSPFSSTSSNIRSTTWSGVRRLQSSSSSPWQAFFSRYMDCEWQDGRLHSGQRWGHFITARWAVQRCPFK